MKNEVFENVMKNGDTYMKAFLKVCEMLEPNTNWETCEMTTLYKGGNILKKPIVRGYFARDCHDVMLTTYEHPKDGLQIVVSYIIDDDIVYQRSIWYYSFNWKGLMETSK